MFRSVCVDCLGFHRKSFQEIFTASRRRARRHLASAIAGANILFHDNSVSWVRKDRLQPVGPWNVGEAGLDLSVLP